MKLFYYKTSETKNFGDDINSRIWDKLLPNFFDDDDAKIFVGIGTILNDHIPKAEETLVFGSGVGYGQGLPKIDKSWKIYCLRGPLSAKALGVSQDLAITDAAVLIRRLFEKNEEKKYKLSYMPHIANANPIWELICDYSGINYINPSWESDIVITLIKQTEILITEAMHGAIAADAFRVPWIPVNTDPQILQFKWQDWCASINIEYKPIFLTPLMPLLRLWPPSPKAGITEYVRKKIKLQIARAQARLAAGQLIKIAKNSKPYLSNDAHIEYLTKRLEEKLEQVKYDNPYWQNKTHVS